MAEKADGILSAFRETEYAPQGEWWREFPLGITFELGGIRRADAVVVTSRQPSSEIHTESTDWFRDRLDSNWLQDERIAIIEVKAEGDKDSWKALGQLQVYEKLFGMDWDAKVDDLIIVAHESVPGEDSVRILDEHIDDVGLYVFQEEGFR